MLRRVVHPRRLLHTVAKPPHINPYQPDETPSFVNFLKSRNLLSDVVKPVVLDKLLATDRQTVYLGVDPTGQYLHIGHLLPLMCLLHFHLHGHQTISLIGGATGRIGDPSGRTTKRSHSRHDVVERNVESITTALTGFFDRAKEYAAKKASPLTQPEGISTRGTVPLKVLNNYEWTKDLTLLDFLESTGQHARMATMIAKESVRSRMESEDGMSFAEFTYQLLQGNDFYHLHSTHDCRIQIGGQDQWGNILAGVDLIQRRANHSVLMRTEGRQLAFGLTTPLLTTAAGKKMGKSDNDRKTIYLDQTQTSALNFYQFFLGTADEDVGKLLDMFTLVPGPQIEEVMTEHMAHPKHRVAQRLLATEVTEMVHGEDGLERAKTATDTIYFTDFTDPNLRADDITKKLEGNPVLVWYDGPEVSHAPICSLLYRNGVFISNAKARATVELNGVTCNGVKLKTPNERLNRDILIDQRVGIINAGKDRHLVIALREPLPLVPKEGLPGKPRGPPNVSNHEKRANALKAERKKPRKLGERGLEILRLPEDLVKPPTWTTPLDRTLPSAKVHEKGITNHLIQVLEEVASEVEDAAQEHGSRRAK